MYYFGDGLKQNNRRAFFWYLKASSHGDEEASNRLGVMLEGGIGCLKNKQKAFTYFLLAAKKGSLAGMYNVGRYYLEYLVNETNKKRGLRWLNKASKLGNGKASFYLGEYYLVSGQIKKAYKYYLLGRQQEYSPCVKALLKLINKGIIKDKKINYIQLEKELNELLKNGN